MMGVKSQSYLTLQWLAAVQVSSLPKTVVVTDKLISTLSNCWNEDNGVFPAKKVLIAGVVYTRRLFTGADKN